MTARTTPLVKRAFRGEYVLDTSIHSCFPKLDENKIVYIHYSDSHKNCIVVDGEEVTRSDDMICYIVNFGKDTNSLMNILVADTLEKILLSIPFTNIEDVVKFKKTKDYSHMRSEVRKMIKDFVINRRESLMRSIFFDRIKFTNKNDKLIEFKTTEKTFGYFIVPKDGTSFTKSIKNMMIVKSDPRNGFLNIVARAYRGLSNCSEGFEAIIKDPNIQINGELSQSIIPFV